MVGSVTEKMSPPLCYLRDSSEYIHGTVATPPPDLCGAWKVLAWPPDQRWYLVSVTGSASYSVSHLLIRRALGIDHNRVERTALQSLSRPNDLLKNHTDPHWWTLAAFVGWMGTVAAVGAAAASLLPTALVSAAIGGTILQLACSMWLRGRQGRIIQFGLGVILTVILVMVIVLLAVVIRKGANTPVVTVSKAILVHTQCTSPVPIRCMPVRCIPVRCCL
jgi:hypothetical protein